MNLNLERLLDEDHLTPAQQRYLRKLASPYLIGKDNIKNQFYLTYTVSFKTELRIHTPTFRELNSLTTYKKVMMELIRAKTGQIQFNPSIMAQVKSLHSKDPLDQIRPRTMKMMAFKGSQSYILVPTPEFITAQTLFKILNIITEVYQNET